ncbi:hypothetical protein GCM10029992_34140 [Glycomyces albus]
MLSAIGVDSLELLTNNPDKARGLRDLGLTVTGTVPTGVFANGTNLRYLEAKVAHTGHSIALASLAA